jgi:hypothetical protein
VVLEKDYCQDKMNLKYIENWPGPLKTQLSSSNSHGELLELMGPTKTMIGIFELFSRAPLPFGSRPVMSRITKAGASDIDLKLAGSGEKSAALAGYSVVAVSKAIDFLTPEKRVAGAVRMLIRECMNEAARYELLLHDIAYAAQTIARLRISQEMASEKNPLEVTNPNIALRPDFNFESLTDRPQDWKFSHWWTGE